jgi:hypothetical protein
VQPLCYHRSAMSRRQLIIVTGAGRSGTSAVAQVLHEAGISMGLDFHEPSEYNPTGYYEDRWITHVNDGILTAAGLRGWFRRASRERVLEAAAPYREEMARIASEAGGGWKDPRFCWTLEAWLPQLERPPKLIVCLRSPRAVVDSTLRRYGQTSDTARRHVAVHWSRQYRRLLEVVHDHKLPALCVEYDALVADPAAAVERLARFVGRPLDAAAIDRSLRHEAAAVPKHHRAVYRQVQDLGLALLSS